MRNGRFDWRRFAFAAAISVGMHVWGIIPRLLHGLILAPPAKELEVSWVPEEDNTEEGETMAGKIPPPPPKPAEPKKKEPKKEQVKAPEPAKVKPEKKKEAELELKPAPPPPPQPLVDHRMQMVDQDHFPEEADNPEAHFLAQKNHRAKEETRAKNTNLLREVKGPETPPSEPSKKRSPESGMKDDKLAELQERQGAKKELVRSAPRQGQQEAKPSATPPVPGPLSMRDLRPKAALSPTQAEKAREGLDKQEEGKGELPMARVGQDQERAVAPHQGGPKVNLNLDNHAFDQIEGFAAAEAARREAARAERSHVAGRWDRVQAKIAAVRSSLENFTPEVKPGNQEELGTRASPFAAYITAMHRQIHKLFTLGFLADIEARNDSAYADLDLWTQLEIVLKADGTVDRVGIVRGSGVLAFDVAAIDSVMSAAPFPPPPQVIKSANGKVYLDWQFHRDERACGTFGVDPHILTTPGDNTQHDTSETGAQWKAMERAAPAGGGGHRP